MFKWYPPALPAGRLYVLEERPFHQSESPRRFPAAAYLSAPLEEALKSLPREQRVVVELAYRFKWSREDIATILNSSVEAISKLMLEGTAALKHVV